MGKGVALLLACLVALGLLYPGKSVDVANLVPVEVLMATVEDGQVKLEGGDLTGYGATWLEAMTDLESHGQAFFGTTGHVVADKSLMEDVLHEPRLRPAAKIYRCVEPLDHKELATYLQVRSGKVTIATVRRGDQVTIPVVLQEKGGLQIA